MGGATSSKTNPIQGQELFKMVSHDQSSGITLLLENQTGNEYCMKQLTTNSRQDVQVFSRHINEKQRNPHPNVLSVVYYRVQNGDGLCSQSSTCYLITEYPFRTLYDELRDRRRNQQPFGEGELLSILYSCVAGLQHIYLQGFRHQSLTSNRIYVDRSGLVKISDPQLLRQPDNLSSLASHSNKQHIYLSPEQLRASFGRHHQQYCAAKSQVFTLGMIMLEAMQLEWMDEMYDPTSINTIRLKSIIEGINRKLYGKALRSLVRSMLEKEPKDRLTLKQVAAYIDNMDIPQTPKQTAVRKRTVSSEVVDPYSLSSSHLHENDLPTRVIVNVQPLDIDQDSASGQHKLEACTKCPPTHFKDESSQSTPQSNMNLVEECRTEVAKTKAVPHKTIQLEIGKTDREDPKARHARRRSRSDKSARGFDNSTKKSNGMKKKQPQKAHVQSEESSVHHSTPQETPNKIFKEFYPFTQYISEAQNDCLRESKRHFNIDQMPLPKSDDKYIRIDLFSSKRRTSSKIKNSASINNSPRPMLTVKKFEIEASEIDVYPKKSQSQCLEQIRQPQLFAEPIIQGTASHQEQDVSLVANKQLRIKTDYYYEEHFYQQDQYRHNVSDFINQSTIEFWTRLRASTSLHSPQRLQADIISEPEEVVLYRIPESQSKKITFGLEQSTVSEKNTFQPIVQQNHLKAQYFISATQASPQKSELKPTDTSLKQSEPLRIDITLPPPAQVIEPYTNLLRNSLKQAISDQPPLPSDRSTSSLQYTNETYKHGGRYQGFKLNGMRQGFGRYFYQDGGYYEGQWHRNKMQGFAKLYYQNSEIAYEGYWRQDMFNGTGKLWNDAPEQFQESFDFRDLSHIDGKWLHYKGCFLDDIRMGVGTLTLTNGELYEGEFRDDRVHGKGKFYSLDGKVHQGTWLNDKLQQ